MFDAEQNELSYHRWRNEHRPAFQLSDIATLAQLKDTYPTYHVTETKPTVCDLLGYADAGFATATPVDTRFTHSVRFYDAPSSRLHADGGKLTDQYQFGCYRYTWRDIDFLIYSGTYAGKFQWVKHLYILHPSGPEKRTNPATDALLLECGKWSKELHKEVYVFDNVQWKKSKELFKSIEGASWDDVILEEEMKERLIHDVQSFFDTRHVYQASKVAWKRGVILHGVPGNGKTVSVKALINSLAQREDSIPALYVKSLDSCQGPKYSIQLIFQHARAMAPCLLVFEDLDSLVTPKTRSYFLNEIDGLESNDGILMIGSTNYLERLDAAITKRPSRFDRKYHFKLPEEGARLAYAQYWCKKFVGQGEMVDFPEGLCPVIAKITDGFSFAYMKELFVASLLALARGVADGVEEELREEAAGAEVAKKTVGEKSGVIDKEVEKKVVVDEVAEEKTPSEKSGTTSEELVIVEKDDKPAAVEATPKPKTKAPVILDIPLGLKGNVFLRILILQATILLREWQNSDKNEDVPMGCSLDGDNIPPMWSPAWFATQIDACS